MPPQFDASGLEELQGEAVSADGTKVAQQTCRIRRIPQKPKKHLSLPSPQLLLIFHASFLFSYSPLAPLLLGQIPYFYIRRTSSSGVPSPAPCLLYGYGGFEIPLLPSYLGATGAAWLERGFTYVQANIRGGGEFGPSWHQVLC